MFEGTIAYHVMSFFDGKPYNVNYKRLVCFIAKGYYKEEFWTDKKNRYFIRIFDFAKQELHQINTRYKTIVTTRLGDSKAILLEEIQCENQSSAYKLGYDLDFGFKSSSRYTYVTDTGIYLDPDNAESIRICSKLPKGNNEIASYFIEEPAFRFRGAKSYKLVGVQPKKIEKNEFELDKFKGFVVTTEKINRVIMDKSWEALGELAKKHNQMMVDFYANELNCVLTEEQKNNIAAFSEIHFGQMDADEYKATQLRLRRFEEG